MTEEPRWLTRRMVDAFQARELQRHGGLPGVRDDGAVESALARPQQKWTYEEAADLADLAAAYGFGLARNHGYLDGNKRVAFVALATFVGLNGHWLDAPEAEAVHVMLDEAAGALDEAAGALDEAALAAWIRGALTPRREADGG